MKMPELLVFVRVFIIGLIGAEVFRAAHYIGLSFASSISDVPDCAKIGGIIFCILLCTIYAKERGAFSSVKKLARSLRIDLLAAIGIGVWANELMSPSLNQLHDLLKKSDPQLAPALLAMFCVVFLSPIAQKHWPRKKPDAPQLRFLTDDEIKAEKDDLYANGKQAKFFADTVLTSDAHPGLVFGLDGPWGVGKTSFINLAEIHWSEAKDKVIVCRFEPLRYASEPDLADRLIRDLSATIQERVYAPEFRPAVSRYSRLVKGKADISFLGFKLSLEPSQETVEELLDDIDEVLKRINRRIIIVVDDLDRLDPKTTNNVLFATRRTFRLSQATYVLCYDTEVLVESKEDGARAREFLEKFVTVKMNLFVDSSSIRDFLRSDWQNVEKHPISVPADTMIKLNTVLSELAEILDSDLAANYLSLVGDLRKIKRFINAMLLMQIEKSDLGRTDFNPRDLINLILLHLNYPGLFRRIYAEESEGRIGTFSVRQDPEKKGNFLNADGFISMMGDHQGAALFLLKQLFDADTLKLNGRTGVIDVLRATRACFNQGNFRNLEGYLKLIVRFATPMLQTTFVLYQQAVRQAKQGTPIEKILRSTDFLLERSDYAHDKFWQALINQSHDLDVTVAEDSINTLMEYLPRYTLIDFGDMGLRKRSIYSLLWLLNYVNWGTTPTQRRMNTDEKKKEIAWRIFGEEEHAGKGLLQRLTDDRGVLGWYDLMLLRLQCSADRQGQLYNIHSSLIVDQDPNAETTGYVNRLALLGMRKLSQQVFALFKKAYIEQQKNFLSETDETPDRDFLGIAPLLPQDQKANENLQKPEDSLIKQLIAGERATVKSFVIYQLSNSNRPTGSGVGCGFYDEQGSGEGHGIANQMNDYIFEVCFNLKIDPENVHHFLQHCLTHLSNPFFTGTFNEQDDYFPFKGEISGGLDSKRMGQYWRTNQHLIRELKLEFDDRCVTTSQYIASYREYLPGVFAVLDELAADATESPTV
ncbi:KAP family NTPase [Pseudomonas sp. D2002]|nr:KAP family NTPase [Pseudomonas sp. D2002]